jgi:hypothetical protein
MVLSCPSLLGSTVATNIMHLLVALVVALIRKAMVVALIRKAQVHTFVSVQALLTRMQQREARKW